MEKDPEWVSNMDEIEAVTLEKHISISRSSLEIIANFSFIFREKRDFWAFTFLGEFESIEKMMHFEMSILC